MGKIEKLIKKLKSDPKDFTWNDLKKLLAFYGYEELKMKGKTGGSRRKFVNDKKVMINLHEPHPQKVIKPYLIKIIIKHLNL